MRAIVQDRYGSPDILRPDTVDKPPLTPDRALVRVHASSINAGDWRRVRGAPVLIRLTEGLRRPSTPLFGGDVAGVVEEVGAEIEHVRPGDEVFGIRSAAFAEYVATRNVVPKPRNLSLDEAAAVPIAGVTALQAVRDHGHVQPGQRILVNGAGGGVGTFAVQLARAFGGSVTAVTGPRNVATVSDLGADRVIDYTREDFTRTAGRHDVVIDVGGNRPIRQLRRALAPGGTLVLVGAGRGSIGPMTRLIGGQVRTRLLRQRLAVFIAAVRTEDLLTLKELIEAAKVRPVIDRTYSLEEVPEALRYVEAGQARGKVVIRIGS